MTWSLELGAKKFHEQRTTGPLLFESASAPPSAGLNVTFEDSTLDTAAGAHLIFARLTAVRTGAYIALELLSRRVTWGRVTLTSILARRRVGRGSGEGAGRPTNRPKRLKILTNLRDRLGVASFFCNCQAASCQAAFVSPLFV